MNLATQHIEVSEYSRQTSGAGGGGDYAPNWSYVYERASVGKHMTGKNVSKNNTINTNIKFINLYHVIFVWWSS